MAQSAAQLRVCLKTTCQRGEEEWESEKASNHNEIINLHQSRKEVVKMLPKFLVRSA